MSKVTKDKSYVAVEDKINALAKAIECKTTDIERSQYDDYLFEVDGDEYLVLSDSEADTRCENQINYSLWAFNAEFIASHTRTRLEDKQIDAIRKMQSELCEDANEIVRALIYDVDYFIKDAINADGRGHFLAQYDFEEIEQDGFYIYRTN